RGDIGVDAPVEIAHRAELAFEQHARVGRDSTLNERQGVRDPIAERSGRLQHAVGDGTGIEGRVAELREDHVLRLELVCDALAERALVTDLVQLDTVTGELVRVRPADALAGSAQPAATPRT